MSRDGCGSPAAERHAVHSIQRGGPGPPGSPQCPPGRDRGFGCRAGPAAAAGPQARDACRLVFVGPAARAGAFVGGRTFCGGHPLLLVHPVGFGVAAQGLCPDAGGMRQGSLGLSGTQGLIATPPPPSHTHNICFMHTRTPANARLIATPASTIDTQTRLDPQESSHIGSTGHEQMGCSAVCCAGLL